MRIAIDINGIFGTSGIAQYIKLLVKNLALIDRENDYLLYFHSWKNPQTSHIGFYLPDNFKIVHHRIPETLALFTDFKYKLGIMEKFLASHGVEIYHGTANLVPRFHRIKSLLTVHHYYPVNSPLQPVSLTWREKFYLKCTDYSITHANLIVTVSISTKYEIINRFRLMNDTVAVIYSGEPDPVFRPLEKKETGGYILFVGPINERKNLPRLLKAFSILVKKVTQSRLVIIGTGKETYIKLIKKLCAKLNIQDKIIWTGKIPTDTMVSFYNNADLLVYPSLYEGFGYPPLEAMACGCPVVASNVTSIPEIIGNAGILFDPYNIEEMAQSMERVLKDSDLKQELIKRGFEQVKKFSWEKTASKTLELYKKLYNFKK